MAHSRVKLRHAATPLYADFNAEEYSRQTERANDYHKN